MKTAQNLACLAVLLLAIAPLASADDEPRRPNVIVILVDDVGYADIGPFGAVGIKTPHLDRMAAEGMKFTDFYAHPVCGVTRAALMTGSYAMRIGEVGNRKVGHPVMHANEVTVAEVMKKAGYATGMIGKWHLAGPRNYPKPLLPNAQGFDYWFGSPTHNGYSRVIPPTPKRFKMELMRNGELVDDEVDQAEMDEITKRYTDEAVGFIRKNKDVPFFLYLAHNMAHVVLGATEEFRGSSKRGLYGDVMQELDASAGRIMATLRELGIADDTLVLFTSDNGPWEEKHLAGKKTVDDHYGRATPLRGYKMTTWEGGVRVPTIAWWPGKVPAGKTCAEIATIMDVLPTAAALAGASVPDDRVIDGRDIRPLLLGEPDAKSPHEAIFYYSYTHLQAVRSGDWKLVAPRPAKAKWLGWSARMTERVVDFELYNLSDDIGEKNNVAAAHPEVVDRLKRLIEKGRNDIGDYDRIGSGARFYDSGPKRAESKRWIVARAVEPSADASEAERPNFIVVFADDLGYADLGCFGSTQIRTPRIDTLAKEGMRFTSFYAQPVCGPSRAAIMTGCYPLRLAEAGNIKRTHPAVHTKEITVAEVLKTRGYATGCFGKWDLAEHSQRNFKPHLMPNHQGFDYFFGTPTSNDGFVDLYRNAERIEEKAPMATLTQRYTDETIAFIERNKDKPFFVYLPHTMPHTRLAASEAFKGKSPRGLYGDVVEEIDHNVGRIVDAVKRMKLEGKTYIIFTSDNGPWLIKNKGKVDGTLPGDHGGSAGPLRSGKVSTWEGGQRVPTIVWAPGRVPAGKSCDAIASTLDVLPTLAALAGADVPTDRKIDGENVAHLLRGDVAKATPGKAYYYYATTHLQAVRQGPWKLHLSRPAKLPWSKWSPNRHIAPVDDAAIPTPQLYNLDDDLGESNDIAAKHPDIVARLMNLADSARADIGDYDRIGAGARFYDEDPKRPESQKWIQARQRANTQ